MTSPASPCVRLFIFTYVALVHSSYHTEFKESFATGFKHGCRYLECSKFYLKTYYCEILGLDISDSGCAFVRHIGSFMCFLLKLSLCFQSGQKKTVLAR